MEVEKKDEEEKENKAKKKEENLEEGEDEVEGPEWILFRPIYWSLPLPCCLHLEEMRAGLGWGTRGTPQVHHTSSASCPQRSPDS